MERKSTPAIRFKGFTDPWEQRKLGDVCEELSYGVGAAAVPFDGQTRYLRITDIDDETHEFLQDDLSSPDPDFALSDNDYLKSGDIVFARTGASVGKTYLNRGKEEDIVFAGFLIRAVLQSSFDSEFIYQQTLSEAYKNFVAITSQRSGQPGINAQEYSNWDLWVCGDKEQVKIGVFFRQLDDLITLHQRKLEMMKNFKKSMLEKMFPKNGSDVPEIRFAGFTDPWEQRKLGEIATFNPRSDLPDEFEYIDLESVVGTEMVGHRRESRKTAPSRAQRLAQVNDIFYQTVRPYQKNNYLYELPENDYVFSTGYAQLRTERDSRFLFCLLQRDAFVLDVLNRCTGTSYPTISPKDMSEIEITIPTSIEEQRQIGTFFRNLDDLVTLHQRKLDKLKDLKKSMLEKMFV